LQELFHKKKEEKPAEDKETIVEAGASDNHQEDVDTILASALSKLSLQEREKAYEEIHGVDLTVEEKPELVADRLEAMEAELQKIHKKPAYDLALQRNKEYVTDRKLRLQFLRAECFDAKKAAARLVKCLEGKLELFGPEVMARPIYLSDLDSDDLEPLQSGFLQFLPARDRSGRAVIVDMMKSDLKCYKRTINMVRTAKAATHSLLIAPYSCVLTSPHPFLQSYIGQVLCLLGHGHGRRRRDAKTWYCEHLLLD
jgi:hypothetical protein